MLVRLHKFIRDIARRQRSGFVKGETITEAINSASSSLWRAKVKQFRKGGDDILLQPFKGTTQISSPYILPNSADYEIIALEPVTQGLPDIVLARNEQEFIDTRLSDDYEHIYKSEFTATINAAANGKFDLPADTFSLGESFYHEYQGSRYEGVILEDREFLDRRNSVLIPATATKPIARIVDDKIEFYPRPTGATTFAFTVPFRKFNPVARYYENGSNIEFKFEPSTYTGAINVFYYKKPALAAATYALSNGIETVTVSTELDWGEQAFPELATRALLYIGGLTVSNQLLAQAESLIEQNDQIDANE